MANKTVKLSKRYEPPGETPFDHITLREPSYQDIVMSGLGFPQEGQPNGQGGVVIMTFWPVIDDYVRRLIVAPEYKDIASLNFVDTKALQDAVCGFFLTAAPTSSSAPPTNSSSGSDGKLPLSSE